LSGSRIVAATFQPLAAKWSAVARPMPLEAPVIKIVLTMALILRLDYNMFRDGTVQY
jgi:hypothetical protein